MQRAEALFLADPWFEQEQPQDSFSLCSGAHKLKELWGQRGIAGGCCVLFLQPRPLFLGRRRNVQPCTTQCFPLAPGNPRNVSALLYRNSTKDLQGNGERGLQLGWMWLWASQPGWSTFTREDFQGGCKWGQNHWDDAGNVLVFCKSSRDRWENPSDEKRALRIWAKQNDPSLEATSIFSLSNLVRTRKTLS